MVEIPEISLPVVPAGTNVLGVGIDIEGVERIRKAVERNGDAFLEKVFSPEEIELCDSKGAHKWESFAARWAAKEAFSKALGTGIGKNIGFADISVLSGSQGDPTIKLSEHGEKALHNFGGEKALVSLTHTKDVASAIIILTKQTPRK